MFKDGEYYFDSDNGAEFINWHLKAWCETHSINFSRGRQYHKNDNAYIEQKNGDIVRKIIGYGRFQGDNALAALKAVYAILNPLYNFFYPNLKCIDKQQIGQKTKRIYEKEPKTPFQRIMERDDIPPEFKQGLFKQKASLDIVEMQELLELALDNLQKFMHHSAGRIDCHNPAPPEQLYGKILP